MSARQTDPIPENQIQLAGWRETVSVPGLNINNIIAKLDTGARTSALHATDIKPVDDSDNQRIRFRVYDKHSEQYSAREVECAVVDIRLVRSSSGVTTNRYVIRETVRIGDLSLPIEFTLIDRTKLRYPMLIGRAAMTRLGLRIDPRRSWRLTRRPG